MKKSLLTICLVAIIIFALFCFAFAGLESQAVIVSVIDGNSINIRLGRKIEKIEVIGLGLPKFKPQNEIESRLAKIILCRAKEILPVGTKVTLRFDQANAGSGNRDKSDRLLAHIILPDGSSFAEKMIKEGYGRLVIESPFAKELMDKYRLAEKEARENGLGLWETDNKYGDWFWQ